MKILIVANQNTKLEQFKKILTNYNIQTKITSYNYLFNRTPVQEFEFSTIILMVNSILEIKQVSLLKTQGKLNSPTILLWSVSKNIPKSLQSAFSHHLTATKDTFETVKNIKDIVYSYTIKDVYNTGNKDMITFEKLTLDRRYRHLKIDNKIIPLRNKEFSLLEFFMLHPKKLLCRNTILESVWDINKTFLTNTIDVHVGKLRKSLGKHKNLIQTVHSIGYIFG